MVNIFLFEETQLNKEGTTLTVITYKPVGWDIEGIYNL